jgi:hypothetical protein
MAPQKRGLHASELIAPAESWGSFLRLTISALIKKAPPLCLGDGVKKLIDSTFSGGAILHLARRSHPFGHDARDEFCAHLKINASQRLNLRSGLNHRAILGNAGRQSREMRLRLSAAENVVFTELIC